MYQPRTQEEILAELQKLYSGDANAVEGGFIYDVLSSNAIEFAKFSSELAELYRAAFATTSWGEYLEMRAAEAGLTRRAANFAVGKVTVTGTGTVPAGSIFSTAGGIRFIATETVAVEGAAEVPIIAESAGAAGNVPAGAISKIPISIAGIRTVTNAEKTIDGYNIESDDALRERYLATVRYPAASGNPQHYCNWALEIVGVGAVRVQRCWNGPGTVKVVVADSELNEANVLLLQRVNEKIQHERPVGAEVSVVSAQIVNIDVSAKIIGTLDVEAVRTGITNYFKKITASMFNADNDGTLEQFSGQSVVSLAVVNSYIVAEGGADDVRDLKLNGAAQNVQLDIDSIPRLGTFDFY